MANRNKKIIIDNDKGKILYENEINDVIVYGDNGILYFKSTNSIFNETFETYDCGEGVSAFLRMKSILNDDDFWKLKIGKNKYDITPRKTLYWLSGGDYEWKLNKSYMNEWKDTHSIFEHKYRDVIYEIIENAITLQDIKDEFIKKLNLPILYEFALSNNLIK